jgi:hypothetical protein
MRALFERSSGILPEADMLPSDPIEALLAVFLAVSVVTCILWFVLAQLDRHRRRAFNLTRAETASGSVKLDFLSVDHAKREAAIARGRAATVTLNQAAASNGSLLSRRLALGAAVVSFATAATSAVQKVGTVQDLYGKAGFFWAHFSEIVIRYWVGFAFAAAVILGNLVMLLYKIMGKSKN